MKLTQKEIHELRKLCTELKVPTSFDLTELNNIYIYYKGDLTVSAKIQRTNNGYPYAYRTSYGKSFTNEVKDFEQLKRVINQWLKSIIRDNPFILSKLDNIESMSPEFYKTFHEAGFINDLGFKESSGMIYRKSLEILVKDFLKQLIPEFEELIIEKTIGQIIFHFYSKTNNELIIRKKDGFEKFNNELVSIQHLTRKINNTFKIGNDFSHYERKLTEFSPKDMEQNIEIIIEFMNNQLEIKSLNLKQSSLDKNFLNDELI
jgi:hypothetical protein